MLSLDLCARRVIMASYFYYRHDESIMPDREFDAMCRRLARNWRQLSDLRRFCLGGADEIEASGYQVYVTVQAQDACLLLAQKEGLRLNRSRGVITKWKTSRYPHPKEPVRYAGLSSE